MPHTTPPQAVTAEKSSNGVQTHFLSQARRQGPKNIQPPMGHHAIEHAVFFFEDRPMGDEHPVAMSLQTGGFSLHQYLSVHEARTLAKALLMAADHAERADLNADIDAAAEAAGVVLL